MPLDYFLRSTGRGDLQIAGARVLPAPDPDHPLAPALLLRILRLTCLTTAYADLWTRLFDPSWCTETWACPWPGLPPLNEVGREWTRAIPLRTERARRAALVEIDALVAVWLGVPAPALQAMYRARFPVLQDFEAVTWFDSRERKIAGHPYTVGHGQTKQHWIDIQADRETEMRAAHAVFQARLDGAIARGAWDPERRKVPTR